MGHYFNIYKYIPLYGFNFKLKENKGAVTYKCL